MSSKTKKVDRWYGMKKLKNGQNVCWESHQDKNGWSLGLVIGKRVLWLRNFRVTDHKEVSRILKAKQIFVSLNPKR